METHPVPILVSRWSENVHTAVVLDGPQSQACATTASAAFSQVRDHVRKFAQKGEDAIWPTIERYELKTKSVTVRLFYRQSGRQFPASRELRLPIRFVLGHYPDDSVECFLPDFAVVFFCPAPRELDRLIDEQVRGEVTTLTSRQLIAAALPIDSEVRTIRVRPRYKEFDAVGELPETLTEIATPMVRRSRTRRPIQAADRYGGSGSVLGQITRGIGQGSFLLVGPPGSGKSTLLRTAAATVQRNATILAKQESKPLPPPIVWQTSAENVIAGMCYLGQWESRLEALIAAADSIGAVLAFDSLTDLIRLGGSGPTESVAAFLDPYLQRGELRMAVECDDDSLIAAKRLLPGFVDHFQIIQTRQLSVEQTRQIADQILNRAARNHRISVATGAAGILTTLMNRLTPHEAPPRGVVEITNNLVDQAVRQRSVPSGASTRNPAGPVIGTEQIVAAIGRRTGLPEIILRDDKTLSLQTVTAALSKHVIGQSRAVDIAAGIVMRIKSGLCDPQRPIATALLSGPTGTGKTQLARSLADYLFGNQQTDPSLIRLDMSEYGSYDGAHRLMIGDDGEVADWIGTLRRRPMSVLLLDEFEKASPEVHDIWLSALDEGRLTDRFGRTTSLCGTIILLTSNVGSRRGGSLGFGGESVLAVRSHFEAAVRETFRIEFINRLDDLIAFDPLTPEVIRRIVAKELRSLAQRETILEHGLTLSWTDDCVDRLSKLGFDPKLGARPLQRAIEQKIVPQIARRILGLNGSPVNADRTIDLDQLLGPLP